MNVKDNTESVQPKENLIWFDAREFAINAHGDQKYGDQPYSYHLDQVAWSSYDMILSTNFLLPVAYLHDVLEDTDIKENDIQKNFGTAVTLAVGYLTDPEGKNRKERKKKLYGVMRSLSVNITYSRAALIVKTADRYCNIKNSFNNNKDLLEMYRKEHKEFKNAVYRNGLCENLWTQMENILNEQSNHNNDNE